MLKDSQMVPRGKRKRKNRPRKRSRKMDAWKAMRLDKKGCFYSDYDKELDCWGVFGTESAFCYSTHTTELEANIEANQKNFENNMFAQTISITKENK